MTALSQESPLSTPEAQIGWQETRQPHHAGVADLAWSGVRGVLHGVGEAVNLVSPLTGIEIGRVTLNDSHRNDDERAGIGPRH